MADEEAGPEPQAPAEPVERQERAEPLAPKQSFVRRHWGKLLIATVLLLPALVFTIWAGITLSYSYSTGQRTGYVQKLSRKGWLCKTWEGELQMSNVPGSAPILFQFSVRDDSIAQAIESMAGRQVSLTYEQHVGVPSDCFGETEYFVTGVREVTR